jgi:hypothetical protein
VQLSWLSRLLLALSVLTSAVVVVILGFVVYLFIGGYSGGSNPTSVTPVLFPIALLLFVFAGVPSMLVCGVMWTGYSLATRRSARPDVPGPPSESGS